jgi:hypothetical protein
MIDKVLFFNKAAYNAHSFILPVKKEKLMRFSFIANFFGFLLARCIRQTPRNFFGFLLARRFRQKPQKKALLSLLIMYADETLKSMNFKGNRKVFFGVKRFY